MFASLYSRAERRIGNNEVKTTSCKARIFFRHSFYIVERVVADDVSVPVVVNNHVHLGDARDGVIDFYTVKIVLREVMPISPFRRRVALKKLFGLRADFIERVQEKPARAAGGVEHEIVILNIHHFDGKTDDIARGEELAALALEKVLHKVLEGDAFRIEVRSGFITPYS